MNIKQVKRLSTGYSQHCTRDDAQCLSLGKFSHKTESVAFYTHQQPKKHPKLIKFCPATENPCVRRKEQDMWKSRETNRIAFHTFQASRKLLPGMVVMTMTTTTKMNIHHVLFASPSSLDSSLSVSCIVNTISH